MKRRRLYVTDDNVPIEVELVASISATFSPYDPGVLSGPVEGCYPPEGGEVEDFTATIQLGGQSIILDEQEFRTLVGDQAETIINDLHEKGTTEMSSILTNIHGVTKVGISPIESRRENLQTYAVRKVRLELDITNEFGSPMRLEFALFADDEDNLTIQEAKI